MFSPIVLSHLDRFGEFDSTVATILVYMRVFCWFCTTKNELGYRLISASPGSLIKTIIKRFLAKLKHAKGHVIWRSRVDKTQPKRANEMERGREVTKTLSDHSTLTSTEVGAYFYHRRLISEVMTFVPNFFWFSNIFRPNQKQVTRSSLAFTRVKQTLYRFFFLGYSVSTKNSTTLTLVPRGSPGQIHLVSVPPITHFFLKLYLHLHPCSDSSVLTGGT